MNTERSWKKNYLSWVLSLGLMLPWGEAALADHSLAVGDDRSVMTLLPTDLMVLRQAVPLSDAGTSEVLSSDRPVHGPHGALGRRRSAVRLTFLNDAIVPPRQLEAQQLQLTRAPVVLPDGSLQIRARTRSGDLILVELDARESFGGPSDSRYWPRVEPTIEDLRRAMGWSPYFLAEVSPFLVDSFVSASGPRVLRGVSERRGPRGDGPESPFEAAMRDGVPKDLAIRSTLNGPRATRGAD